MDNMNVTEKIDMYLFEEENEETIQGEKDEFLSDLMESVFDLLEKCDIENFDEEQKEILEEILDMYDDAEEIDGIDEATRQIKKVVRGGKRIRKVVCGDGYKALKGKCVKMSSSEKRVRHKAGIKAGRKSKGKRAMTARKRAKSMKKRI